jgi:hypothetical protein
MVEPWIEEWLLNSPPGSKAAAKEFGVDLTLLLEQPRLTPQRRLDCLQGEMKCFASLIKSRKSQNRNAGKSDRPY